MKYVVTVALLVSSISSLSLANEKVEPLSPSEYRVGEQIPNLAIVDTRGGSSRLSSYLGPHNQVVFVMFKHDCPLSKRFMPALAELIRAKGQNIPFFVVNTSEEITDKDLAVALEDLGKTITIVPDRDHLVARTLMAQTTTETFVVDKSRTLRYRGPVNDQYEIGVARESVSREYLRDAINAVHNRREVVDKALVSPGCVLDLKTDEKVEKAANLRVVDYFSRVSRIVQNKCQSCHHAGGAAGVMPFETYAQLHDNAAMIKRVIENKSMPPWFASTWSGPFENDRSLTTLERQDFVQWLDNKMPEGRKDDAPVEIRWPTGWRLGQVDAEITIPQPISVPASGVMAYQYIQVRTNFDEDKWVTGTEVIAENPGVVHHVLIFIANSHASESRGLSGHFASLVPGTSIYEYPKDTAILLPRGATLQFQIHYTPNGRAVTDRPRLGLRFAKTRPQHEIQILSSASTAIDIPAGAQNHRIEAQYVFPSAFRILSFLPHMHMRGSAYRYQLVYPNGKTKVVLEIPKYDFNWQVHYKLHTPIDVPAGTRLQTIGWYDNSPGNRNNPNPNQRVRLGEQTTDEMMIGYFDGYRLP